MKKRILVTGGAGFIGSHLCEKLLRDDNEVICVDNFFTGRNINIIQLMQNPFFEIIWYDITSPLYKILDQFDFVYGANPTSANIDAYIANLPVVVYLDKSGLNMSPLLVVPRVNFVGNVDDLVSVLDSLIWGVAENNKLFFWFDDGLLKCNELINKYRKNA